MKYSKIGIIIRESFRLIKHLLLIIELLYGFEADNMFRKFSRFFPAFYARMIAFRIPQ